MILSVYARTVIIGWSMSFSNETSCRHVSMSGFGAPECSKLVDGGA